MSSSSLEYRLIEAMAKHLPPSAAVLRLLDVGGKAGEVLAELRGDLEMTAVEGPDWVLPPESMDAVVVYDSPPDVELLRSSLAVLRPGGRFVLVNPTGEVHEMLARLLRENGFTRTLVEAAVETPAPIGVLIRGEKPQVGRSSVERVRQAAGRDDDPVVNRSGRYIHLLIQQTPNQPAWQLEPGQSVDWHAVAVVGNNENVLLAFSSLPKAVAFMQPAVLAGRIQDVNKVAKFSWETARKWPYPLMLNPTDDILETNTVILLPMDPNTAEASDE